MINVRPALLIFLSVSVSHAPLSAAGSWKPVNTVEGITVYTMPVEDSPMDAFKGVADIAAPIESVSAVINDIPAQPRWMASCTEARVLKRFGQSSVLIYRVTKAPWPVSDRDMVVISSTTVDAASGRVIADFKITGNHGVPPRKGMVRMKKMNGKWILEKLSPGDTRVTFIVHSDPGGSIPPSIANRASRDIPLKTLQGLRRIVQETKYRKP